MTAATQKCGTYSNILFLVPQSHIVIFQAFWNFNAIKILFVWGASKQKWHQHTTTTTKMQTLGNESWGISPPTAGRHKEYLGGEIYD